MPRQTTKVKNGVGISNLDGANPQRILVKKNAATIGEIWWMPRNTWGGGELGHKFKSKTKAYPYPLRDEEGIRKLAIHHSAWAMNDYDADGTKGNWADIVEKMRILQTARQKDLGPEVPYSYVIFRHPKNPAIAILAEGRGNCHVGAHTGGYNSKVLGVSFDGNYEKENPTAGQMFAADFCGRAFISGGTLPATGHRDYKKTTCPGGNLYPQIHKLDPDKRDKGLEYSVLPLLQDDIDAQAAAEIKQPSKIIKEPAPKVEEKEKDNNAEIQKIITEIEDSIKKLKRLI